MSHLLAQDPYPFLDREGAQLIVYVTGSFLAGGSLVPRKEQTSGGTRRVILGRTTWTPHYGGKLTTNERACWLLMGDRSGQRELFWRDGERVDCMLTPRTILSWLGVQSILLEGYVPATPVNVREALVQVYTAIYWMNGDLPYR